MITKLQFVATTATRRLAGDLFVQPVLGDGNATAGKELGYPSLGCHGIETTAPE